MADVLTVPVACPVPKAEFDRVQLGHGSGGKMSARLLEQYFLPHFGNNILNQLGDAAVVPVHCDRIAVSTDSFVVRPLEFPGGNIGSLAVHGTLNDITMMGAQPLYLSAGFILEEGLSFEILERVLASMRDAALAAGVSIVTGDTKVVERGSCDGMYINTTGFGAMLEGFNPSPDRAHPGDVVLVSGPMGRHGIAVMSAREGLDFDAEVQSDAATLNPLVERLRAVAGGGVHVLRDPTRGGVASALNEIAQSANMGIVLDEESLPIPGPVTAACEMLGLDPLYVANEGILVAIVAPELAEWALESLRGHNLGRDAAGIGIVTADHPGMVVMKTALGSTRVVDTLPGDQLPRIC